jgi:hypothetical protein
MAAAHDELVTGAGQSDVEAFAGSLDRASSLTTRTTESVIILMSAVNNMCPYTRTTSRDMR